MASRYFGSGGTEQRQQEGDGGTEAPNYLLPVKAEIPSNRHLPAGALRVEAETSRFLTNLRRLTEDKLRKWTGAVTVARAEYVVKA